jgi:3-hydroxybutyryl-CoA dehydrogenase
VTPRLGIAGAGTMGSGIAAAARDAGLRVVVHDPDPAARDRVDGVEWADETAGLAGCGVILEAAPEDLAVKQALLRALAGAVGDDAVLATNTSSLAVTEIAAAVPRPERVVGLHFFNPPAKMRLVELVAGEASSAAALAQARAVAEAMGKHVIEAADGPGFLVNRCNRPFTLEALRIVQERIATPEQVDRICRAAGGFRMGPFELMDLVGLDVGPRGRAVVLRAVPGRAALAPVAARSADGGRGTARPQDGPRLVRAPARPPRGSRRARRGRR